MGLLKTLAKIGSSAAFGPIAAIGSVVGDAVGGVLGYKAQKKANKTNLEIADRTNLANQQIAATANKFQYKMMLDQMDYASPAKQREMLEEAGMNPYLYASQSAHAGSAPTAITGAPQVGAQMMPENALAQGLQAATADMANVYGTLMDANKKKAETESLELQNQVFMQDFEMKMKLAGLDKEFNEIRNKFAESKEKLSVEYLKKQGYLTDAQIDLLSIQELMTRWELEYMKPRQMEQVIEATKLIKEQQKSEENLREYRTKLADAGLTNATTNKFVAWIMGQKMPSEIEYNTQAAENQRQQASVNEVEASIKRAFGAKTADAVLEKLNAEGSVSRAEAHRIWTHDRKLQQEMRFDEFYGHVQGVAGTLKVLRGK